MSSLQETPTLGLGAPQPKAQSSFAQIFNDALQNTKDLQAISKQDAVDVALGNADNLSQVMINSAKASTAMKMTVELTSRVVSSYKEMMQMQV